MIGLDEFIIFLEGGKTDSKFKRVMQRIRFAEAYKCIDLEVIERQPSYWIENLLNYWEALSLKSEKDNGK